MSAHNLTRCGQCKRPFTLKEQADRRAKKAQNMRNARDRSRALLDAQRKAEAPLEDAVKFLKQTGLTQRQVAAQLGIDLSKVYRMWVRIRRERNA